MKTHISARLALAPLVLTLAGLCSTANAQEFIINASVSNAVSITENTAMSFGNLFATTTKAGGLAADSHAVRLEASGAVTGETVVLGTPPVVYLGGATAGNYTIPGVPIGTTIFITVQNSAGNKITNAPFVTADNALTCNYTDAQAAIAANKVVLTAGGPGNGNFSAFFCVDRFTASIGATNQTAALLQQTLSDGTGYPVPGASLGNVTFTMGASLVAQSGSAVTTFEQTAYSGVFNMEVGFK